MKKMLELQETMDDRSEKRAELAEKVRQCQRSRDRIKPWPRNQRKRRWRKHEAFRWWVRDPERVPRKGSWVPVSEDVCDMIQYDLDEAKRVLAEFDAISEEG